MNSTTSPKNPIGSAAKNIRHTLGVAKWAMKSMKPTTIRPSLTHITLLFTLLFSLLWAVSYTQPVRAATLLPLPEATFFDANGNPLTGGSVYFYIPMTLTPKDTWQDASGSTLNTNPVILNSAGRAIIYGTGSYRQIVKDSLGNTIWDQVTADTAATTGITWGGTSAGSANVQTVTASGFVASAGAKLIFIAGFTNTSGLTVNVNATGAVTVLKPSLAGAATLLGGEVTVGNVVELDYDGTQFNIIDPVETNVAGTSSNIASAATTDLGTLASHNANITGVVTITSFGSTANVVYPIYFVKFAGALTLTYNASSLIIPGAQSITTSAGDTATVEYLGAGAWRVRNYTFASTPFTAPPQGRLTLTTGTPVMTADVTTSGSVFYTPYLGNLVPVWNGINYSPTVFTELTLTLNNPAHVLGSNYDVFVANNSTTLTACTGPVWTSDTARGTGAGTTELERKFGLEANKNSITCRNGATTFTVAADAGTYVGTFRTSGTAGDTLWTCQPAAAAGGGNARLYLWNMYNRAQAGCTSRDSTDTWNYTLTTVRAADGNNSNRVGYVLGFNEDAVQSVYSTMHSDSSGASIGYVGVCRDATNAFSGQMGSAGVDTSGPRAFSSGSLNAPLTTPGFHFDQACEAADATGTHTWYGDNGLPLLTQMAISTQGRF